MSPTKLRHFRINFTEEFLKRLLKTICSNNTFIYALGHTWIPRDFQGLAYKEALKWNKNVIVVDITEQVLPTIIHEFLHLFYPKWNEQTVLKIERLIVNTISIREGAEILRLFTKYLKNK